MITRGLWLGIVYWRLERRDGFLNPPVSAEPNRVT